MSKDIKADQTATYERMLDILGPKYVSNEPCAMLSYAAQTSGARSFGKERLSDVVVVPSSTPQIQNIITFAQRSNVPVAIWSSAIASYWTLSRHGGIILDMKRMNHILAIDEDNCLVTSQAGCPLLRLTSEMLRKRMFLSQAGAPSTCLLGSQYTYGNVNKASARLGWTYRSIVGWEMVLPDGTVLRNGSRANAYESEQFWAHGPGPDLWLLPRYAMAQFGVVTEMTIKGHTLDEEIKCVWVAFNDIEDMQQAYIEFNHAEICTGSSLYSNFKTCYACDTNEASYRITRMYPEMEMILTLQGTPRRVTWEEKRLREIAEKYNGRIVTDQFPPFQAAFDSQLSMAGSFYSEYTTRYMMNIGTGGLGIGLTLGGLDDIETCYKYCKRVAMEHEWAGDPNGGFYADTCGPGMITYPNEAGHFTMIELMGPGQGTPGMAKAHHDTIPAEIKFRLDTGLQSDMHGGTTVPGRRDYGDWPVYLNVVAKFQETLDPNNIMHPGTLFPPMFR